MTYDDEGQTITPDDERNADLQGFTPRKLIAEYIKLRNWKEAEEEAFEEHIRTHAGDRMKMIESIMLGKLNEMGTDRLAAKGIGTAHKQRNASCRIVDPLAFQQFVVTHKEWDAIDWRANKTFVKDLVEAGQVPPPGVDYQVFPVVRFRKG